MRMEKIILGWGGGGREARASAENFPGGRGYGKDTENSIFKPVSTIFVPCMKIQVGPRSSLPPAADVH